jgi:hypothetical protein
LHGGGGSLGHKVDHDHGGPLTPPGDPGHRPRSAPQDPNRPTDAITGTVYPAQRPKTSVDLGPGGCLLSVPPRPTTPPQRAERVWSVPPPLQYSSHPKNKVKNKSQNQDRSQNQNHQWPDCQQRYRLNRAGTAPRLRKNHAASDTAPTGNSQRSRDSKTRRLNQTAAKALTKGAG